MRDTTDATLLQQGAVLKFLPSTIADVMTVFDPQELRFVKKITLIHGFVNLSDCLSLCHIYSVANLGKPKIDKKGF